MQTAKMPDGTIIIQLHSDVEFNALGTVLMAPHIHPDAYSSVEQNVAGHLSRQLADAMMEDI